MVFGYVIVIGNKIIIFIFKLRGNLIFIIMGCEVKCWAVYAQVKKIKKMETIPPINVI